MDHCHLSLKNREAVTIMKAATGKECIHLHIKMMENHQGDPPKNIFDITVSKARRKKGKVKKMIDVFSSFATTKKRRHE